MNLQYRYTVYYDTEFQVWRIEDFMENGIYDKEGEDFLPVEDYIEEYRRNESSLAKLIGDGYNG